MGKKGAALRAAKAQATTYTFTKEQLAVQKRKKSEWQEVTEDEETD